MDRCVGFERGRELLHSLRNHVNSLDGKSLETTDRQRMYDLCVPLLLHLILQLSESVNCE